MSDEVFSKKITWRGIEFDSVLEANWAATLTVYGIDWVFHPGSIWLGVTEWQPDFLLKNAGPYGEDILFEVKGDHNMRIEKAYRCQSENPDKTVLIGREGFLRGDDMNEYPGAVWHRADEVNSSYDWDVNGYGEVYTSANAIEDYEQMGMMFYRALKNTNYVK